MLADLWEGNQNGLAKKVEQYNDKYKFFNYEIEFPEVFTETKTGFDIVIGNPPWDKTKFDDKDFFSQFKTDYRTLSKSEQETIEKNLLSKEHIRKQYEESQKFIKTTNEYYGKNYPYNKGSGDGNLFRLFVENNLNYLADNGSLVYVIPSALMFEEGSTNLRKYIFENFKVEFFYSFENNKAIFPSVHRSYKFALIKIINSKVKKQNIATKFMILEPEELYNKNNIINYTTEMIDTFSSTYKSLFECKDMKDFPIIEKAYSKYSVLSTDYMDFKNELHMKKDEALFLEEKTKTPLYQGCMIHQFNSNFAKPFYFLNMKDFDKRLESKEIKRLKETFKDVYIDAKPETKKNYIKHKIKVTDLKDFEKNIVFDRNFFRLAFRAIASDTNERTLLFSMLPKNCGAGNSLYTSIPKNYILESNKITTKDLIVRSLFLMSIFNSLVVDFIAREMIQMNVNKTYILRLPIPQPSDSELTTNKDYKKLIRNSLILTLHNDWNSFKELAKKFDIAEEDTTLTDKQVDLIKIENDIIIAKLYDITKEELTYLCSTFKVLNRNNPAYCATLIEKY